MSFIYTTVKTPSNPAPRTTQPILDDCNFPAAFFANGLASPELELDLLPLAVEVKEPATALLGLNVIPGMLVAVGPPMVV